MDSVISGGKKLLALFSCAYGAVVKKGFGASDQNLLVFNTEIFISRWLQGIPSGHFAVDSHFGQSESAQTGKTGINQKELY